MFVVSCPVITKGRFYEGFKSSFYGFIITDFCRVLPDDVPAGGNPPLRPMPSEEGLSKLLNEDALIVESRVDVTLSHEVIWAPPAQSLSLSKQLTPAEPPWRTNCKELVSFAGLRRSAL
jgi:hypothetical protein